MADKEKFMKQLFERNYDLLIREAYRYVCEEGTAQDLVQETFLHALINCDKLMDHPNPDAWLSLTLHNIARNYRRLYENRLSVSFDQLEKALAAESSNSLSELLPAKLTESERQLLLWRFEQGLSYREIGERLGVTETTCRVRMFRLMKKCKKFLEN